MPNGIWEFDILDNDSGLSLEGSLDVTVTREDNGSNATLFEDVDGNTGKSNPFTTTDGKIKFYADQRIRYKVAIVDQDTNTREFEDQSVSKEVIVDTVDSVSTLQSSSFPTTLERLYLSGYYGAGTLGGGELYADRADNSTADNGGTVFVDADGVRWKRNVKNKIDVRWFGVFADDPGDGTGTDQYSDFSNALSEATGKTLLVPESEDGSFYKLDNSVGPLSPSGARTTLEINGKIYYTHTGPDKTDSVFRIQYNYCPVVGVGEITGPGVDVMDQTGENVCAVIRYDQDSGDTTPRLGAKVKGIKLKDWGTVGIQFHNCVSARAFGVECEGAIKSGSDYTAFVDTQQFGVYISDSHGCKVVSSTITDCITCVKISSTGTSISSRYSQTAIGAIKNSVINCDLLEGWDHAFYSGGSQNSLIGGRCVSTHEIDTQSLTMVALNGENEICRGVYIESPDIGGRSRVPEKNQWIGNHIVLTQPVSGTPSGSGFGIGLTSQAADSSVVGCIVADNIITVVRDSVSGYGVRVESNGSGSIESTSITGNVIEGAYYSGSGNYSIDDAGIRLLSTSAGKGNVVSNNTLFGAFGNRGIRIDDCESCIISGNSIDNADTRGLQLSGVVRSVIVSNSFNHDGTTGDGSMLRAIDEDDGTIITKDGSNTVLANEFGNNITTNLNAVISVASYSESNVTENRSFDASSVTTADLADVVGTLIQDLRKANVVQ